MKKLVDKKVAVVGAGFVGLAHSLILASKYAEVVLFDRKEPLINDLKGGNVALLTEDESLIELAEIGIKMERSGRVPRFLTLMALKLFLLRSGSISTRQIMDMIIYRHFAQACYQTSAQTRYWFLRVLCLRGQSIGS